MNGTLVLTASVLCPSQLFISPEIQTTGTPEVRTSAFLANQMAPLIEWTVYFDVFLKSCTPSKMSWLRTQPVANKHAARSVNSPSLRFHPRKYPPIVETPTGSRASQCQTFGGEMEAKAPHSGGSPVTNQAELRRGQAGCKRTATAAAAISQPLDRCVSPSICTHRRR